MHDLIRNLPAAIFEYAFYPDGKHRFHYVSERSSEIFGLSADDLLKDASVVSSIFPEGDAGVFTDMRAATITCEITTPIILNGVIKTVRFTYSDQTRDSGVVVRSGIALLPINNTELPADHPHRDEDLFEKLPIGVVIHQDGIVKLANSHAHMLIGATKPRQLIGLRAIEFVHPDYHAGILDRINQVSSGQKVPMAEEKFICFDGHFIDVETLAFPFLYNGAPAVQVIFRDITERKKAEARVRKSETLFRQLFQNVPMAVVMLDDNGKVTEINRGFEEMFGFNKDDLRGRNLNDFIVPDDLQNEGIDLNNLITTNRAVSMESIRKHKSGRLVNVILCGVPVIFENQAIGIYGVYINITDRKRVEEELKVRNAELDNFVYKVSHDLRAPLSSVLGLVNLSQLHGNTDNPFEYLRLIGEKIQALDNFIGDVLSHSKNLKVEVTVGKVDLSKIIEQTFTDLGYLKGAREIRRLIKIDGIEFHSDYWRVSEIFRNLISNAIKYRRPDADDSEIVIKILVDHLCADITFADNGIGINESSMKRVFEMFYRATEQGEGSGIGLYIVKNAVEKLGGQIKVASKPDHGTRFHILLPNRINSSINTSRISEA